jgi:uncharacterized membrane protein
MAQTTLIDGSAIDPAHPLVRKIGIADLRDALSKGLSDYRAHRTDIVFLGLIYPVLGLALARLASGADFLPLIFPLIAGFALLGPFAAIGLYELSRRREQGLTVKWTNAFDVMHSPSFGAILILGAVTVAIFLLWLETADALYAAIFGAAPPESLETFASDVLFTPTGWTLIAIGNAVGFIFAVIVLTLGVVSFPLLVDARHGGSSAEKASIAVQTSARAVVRNPVPMAAWGLIVAAALVVGSIPFLIGLAVVVPVLAHSTWHLYRKVVA